MMRGRSSWSSRLRVSIGEPASRSSSAPTSRSVSACSIALVEFDGAVRRRARRGSARRRGRARSSRPCEDGFGVGDRFGAQRAVDDPPLHRLAIGQPKAADMKRRRALFVLRGTSASTGRCRPGRAAARPDPSACSTDRGSRQALLVPRPNGLRAFGGVGPRPPFLPFFLFLAVLREEPLRPNGIPI